MSTPTPERAASTGETATVALAVSGMTCGGCAATVTRVLSRVPGVAEARVDLASGSATVIGTADPAVLIRAIDDAGFSGRLL
ncbi:MAG: heavy-metal-associated domain-containing protein [Steroidobacteraceae bacterium]